MKRYDVRQKNKQIFLKEIFDNVFSIAVLSNYLALERIKIQKAIDINRHLCITDFARYVNTVGN